MCLMRESACSRPLGRLREEALCLSARTSLELRCRFCGLHVLDHRMRACLGHMLAAEESHLGHALHGNSRLTTVFPEFSWVQFDDEHLRS